MERQMDCWMNGWMDDGQRAEREKGTSMYGNMILSTLQRRKGQLLPKTSVMFKANPGEDVTE